MFVSRAFLASVLLGCAAATTHSGEVKATATHSVAATASHASPMGAASPAAAGMVNTHVIQVGGPNGTLKFLPSNVIAEVGDLVQFQFMPKNHSVVQSTFDQPCIPIQNIMPNKTDAFFSGFMPTNRTAADTKNILTYTIRVKDKKPIWFYCSQGQHCQNGMVGAINAATTGNKTVEAFASLAKQATANLSPGQNPAAAAPPAASSGTAPSGAAESTGAGSTATGTGSLGEATGTATTSAPVQLSTGAAPGQLLDAAKQSLLGVGLAGFAAFMAL